MRHAQSASCQMKSKLINFSLCHFILPLTPFALDSTDPIVGDSSNDLIIHLGMSFVKKNQFIQRGELRVTSWREREGMTRGMGLEWIVVGQS